MRMLRIKLLILSLFIGAMALDGVMAQQPVSMNRNTDSSNSSSSDDDEDPCVDPDDKRNCWTIDPITGIHYKQVPDTSHIHLADRQTMWSKSLGLVYTGNLFSPHYITNIFDRRTPHDFIYLNAYQLFDQRPENILFWDTRIPYTAVEYHTSGTSVQSNDHFKLTFAGNLNHNLGFGTLLDYVYARGEYESQATKPLKWVSYAYYKSDRYHANLTYSLQKLANQENGGIQDMDVILSPEKYESAETDPHTMMTNLRATWNDMNSWNIHFTHNYEMGRWDEVINPEDSTDIYDEFTSIASIFHSVDYESYDHIFRMDQNADQTTKKNFFPDRFIRKDVTQDSAAYASFSTYAGLRVNEGFSKWSQMGLAAFIGYQHQSYYQGLGPGLFKDSIYYESKQMRDTVKWANNYDPASLPLRNASNNVFVGGQLSRHKSDRFSFDVVGKFCIYGDDKQGDYDVNGRLQAVIPAGKNDSIVVAASGYTRRDNPSYLHKKYYGNHMIWNNNFNATYRQHAEGHFRYSLTGTEAKVGLENIKGHIYFDSKDHHPHQAGKMINVVSTEITQRLHWKAIHFDNTVLLQYTDERDIYPLPKFVWHTDLSLRFVIAHTLTTQLGVSGYYFSKYKTPVYQPATQQFEVQDEYECGDYPVVNAYVNCNLKRIKFYLMYSNFGTNFFSNDVFHMPNYGLMSPRLEYGVVFDLQD